MHPNQQAIAAIPTERLVYVIAYHNARAADAASVADKRRHLAIVKEYNGYVMARSMMK